METQTLLRDAFWATPPKLPDGLLLQRREPIVVTRAGPGGTAVYDLLELSAPGVRVSLLAAYQTRLLASHLDKLKERLVAVAQQRRDRPAPGQLIVPAILPAIVTDVAKPSVVDACRRLGIAVIDQRGALIVSGPGAFILVEGKGIVERPWRGRLFSGKASRIVRFLLTTAAFETVVLPRTAQAIATACDLSYVYAHGVLKQLERSGFIDRRTSHAGFRLKDPLGLLRAWVTSGEKSPVAVEPFYAPSTSPAALRAASSALTEATGDVALFSLASALEPSEVHVAGLPHGAYWPGDLAPLIDAFGLRRTTPHNFLVLRPDPVVWTAAGGLLLGRTDRPEGKSEDGFKCVPLPQLAADFASLAGRGREQADFLVGLYARRLPYRVDDA